MLDRFIEVLGNSHFEAYVGGPIAGVVAAFLFQGFGGGSAKSENRLAVPLPVNIYEFRSTVLREQGKPDNGFAFGAMIAGVLIAFLFVALLPALTDGIQLLNVATLVFGLTSAMLGALNGWVRSIQWWLLAIFSSMIAAVCFVLIGMAFDAIHPDVIRYAQNSFNANSDRLSHIFSAAFDFLKAVSPEYWRWMVWILLGFCLVVICSISALVRIIHYLALSKIAAGSSSHWWIAVAVRTRSYGSLKHLSFMVGALVIAYWLITGGAYRFMR
ncbi:hypothetical protein ACOTF2_13310 [Achromobacter xylosoxidans]